MIGEKDVEGGTVRVLFLFLLTHSRFFCFLWPPGSLKSPPLPLLEYSRQVFHQLCPANRVSLYGFIVWQLRLV